MSGENKHEWSIYQKLAYVQQNLKVEKTRYNKFGDFHYYNLNDILAASKLILDELGVVAIIHDEITSEAGWHYVKAVVRFIDLRADGTQTAIESYAYAREAETKPKMDVSQVTGSASSYARKYALNGLFAIDDTKDADNQDNRGEGQNQQHVERINQLIRDVAEFIKFNLYGDPELAEINKATPFAGQGDQNAIAYLETMRSAGQDRMKESKGK